MPAAAKIEKPTSGDMVNGKSKIASDANNGTYVSNSPNMYQDPQKIANSIIEKKIRNLEKRKTRLLELKALEDKGQKLEADQKVAVKKLENVVEMIDMLKEIGKNVTDGLNEHAKQLKKQQKKEYIEKQTERQQQELQRSRLWLISQLIVAKFLPLEAVKSDLMQGKIGEIKLEAKQVEALDKLNEFMTPQSFDLIDASLEKINCLLEGNKREFNGGVSYFDLKDILGKFIDSKYFENVVLTETTNASNENAKSETEDVISNEPVQNEPEKSEEQIQGVVDVKQPAQNVHHINNPQLCFMRDPVVENELQHKDPAVVAVASLGYQYPPPNVQALSTSSGSNLSSNTMSPNNYPPQIFPPVSIPTQTFTNPSYMHGNFTMIHANHYPVGISEQQIPVTSHNVVLDPTAGVVIQSDKSIDVTNEKTEQFSPETHSKEASQDADFMADSKPIPNGNFENRGPFQKNRPRGRGGYREFNNYRGGRGGGPTGNKGNFGNGGGYYNNSGNAQNSNFNPNNRPPNRQNGTGSHRPYRQDRGGGGVRNQNHFTEQADSLAAK